MIKYVDIQNIERLCSSIEILTIEMNKLYKVDDSDEYMEYKTCLHIFRVSLPNQAHRENIFDDVKESKVTELIDLCNKLIASAHKFAERHYVYPKIDFGTAITSLCFVIRHILEK